MESILRIASVTGVDVELKVAGPGARSYAFVIDWHIRFLLAAAWLFAGLMAYSGLAALRTGAPDTPGYWLFVVLPAGAIYLLYHPVLEILLKGQTPGKRIAGVRLVSLANGGAPSAGALLVRNLFRLVDMLPGFYVVGLLMTMVTKNAVRIGDVAAGTVLVYDEPPSAALLDRLGSQGVERLGLAHAQLVRELLDRWPQLGSAARTRLAAELLGRLGLPTPSDEAALRARLEELIA